MIATEIPDFWIGVSIGVLAGIAIMVFLALGYGRRP